MVAEDGTSITYTFAPEGKGASFTRLITLGSAFANRKPLPVTHDTEWLCVKNLKTLVENIIWKEQKGRDLVLNTEYARLERAA
jgi:hypothetical protein